jgi:hypothetical protein
MLFPFHSSPRPPSRGTASRAMLPRQLEDDLLKASKSMHGRRRRRSPSSSSAVLALNSPRDLVSEIAYQHLNKNNLPPARESDDATSPLEEVIQIEREVSTLQRKLGALEQETNRQRDENLACEAILARLETQRGGLDVLRAENGVLRSKMQAIEGHLGEIGLVWVGSGGEETTIEDTIPGSNPPLTLDSLVRKVAALNDLLLDETNPSGHVSVTVAVNEDARFAQLVHLPQLRVTIYSDGISLAGEFMPYDGTRGRLFVRDIADGYFPSEFEGRFPHGVRILVENETRLSGLGQQSCNDRGGGAKQDTKSCGSKKHAEYIINSIPSTVIRNGNIITDVRAGIERRLGVGAEISTAATTKPTAGNSGGMATIHIRAEDGTSLGTFTLNPRATTGELREKIDERRKEIDGRLQTSKARPYELQVAGTNVRLSNLSQKLQEGGISAGSRSVVLMKSVAS